MTPDDPDAQAAAAHRARQRAGHAAALTMARLGPEEHEAALWAAHGYAAVTPDPAASPDVCTAHHEGGHAALGYLVGEPAYRTVTIDAPYTGSPLRGVCLPHGERVLWDAEAYVAGLGSLAPDVRAARLLVRLEVSLAGPAAEHLLHGRIVWDGVSERDAHVLARALYGPLGPVAVPWHWHRVQAALAAPRVWPAVRAVADLLLASRTITGAHAVQVLEAGIPDLICTHRPVRWPHA